MGVGVCQVGCFGGEDLGGRGACSLRGFVCVWGVVVFYFRMMENWSPDGLFLESILLEFLFCLVMSVFDKSGAGNNFRLMGCGARRFGRILPAAISSNSPRLANVATLQCLILGAMSSQEGPGVMRDLNSLPSIRSERYHDIIYYRLCPRLFSSVRRPPTLSSS